VNIKLERKPKSQLLKSFDLQLSYTQKFTQDFNNLPDVQKCGYKLKYV